MAMEEKMRSMICSELATMIRKVETGIITRVSWNVDRMFSSDGTTFTSTVINFLEEPPAVVASKPPQPPKLKEPKTPTGLKKAASIRDTDDDFPSGLMHKPKDEPEF